MSFCYDTGFRIQRTINNLTLTQFDFLINMCSLYNKNNFNITLRRILTIVLYLCTLLINTTRLYCFWTLNEESNATLMTIIIDSRSLRGSALYLVLLPVILVESALMCQRSNYQLKMQRRVSWIDSAIKSLRYIFLKQFVKLIFIIFL